MAFADMTLRAFLEDLGSRSPAPGGGAAGALAGALAAACAQMVHNFTQEPLDIREGTEAELVACCLALADADALAFGGVAAAYKLPRDSSEGKTARQAAIQAALRRAAEVPLQLAEAAVRILGLAEPLARSGNRNVQSDVLVSAQLAEAALLAAETNVRVNLALIKDEGFKAEAERRLQAALGAARGLRQQAVDVAGGRG